MSTEPAVPVNPEGPAPTTSATPEASQQPRRSSRRLVAFTFALAALVLAVDQLTKQWAISTLVLGEQHDVIGEYFSIRLVMNPGAALGIGQGYTWVLTILVVIVVAVIVRVISRIRSRAWAITLGLLLGGALGNLGDRLFRYPGFARGHVVDFIGYWNWFTGNVADIAIVVAAVMLALLSLVGIGLDGTRESHRTPAEGPTETESAA